MLLNKIQDTNWKNLENSGSPFLSYEFFLALEESYSIGGESGWNPIYFEESGKSLLYTFEKKHSYGEYIFDWNWARSYEYHGIPYYPKLTSMVPFTSATTSHFLGESSEGLMDEYEEFYLKNNYSSSHFLFLSKAEIDFFSKRDYLIRESFQYHFVNESYMSFDDFLSRLKTRKAKQIKKERRFEDDVRLTKISGNSLTIGHAREMYQFYLSTIDLKGAIPYLNEDFFIRIFDTLKNQIVYVQAKRNDEAIAGALYFFSQECLYGRYWGSKEDLPNLHFELCYYQGIDICLNKGLRAFEAGAQGEHKISRGFRPTRTYSAHKLKHPSFHSGVKEYIENEKKGILKLLPKLSERLPFKK